MSLPVLIVDDSGVARKQMARSLPADWEVEVTFAKNGQEGLEQILAGKGDVVFLDLNMPVMDGYETLEALKAQDIPSIVIVVSGDIQPDARARVMNLGAFEFIKKPINTEDLTEVLRKTGLYSESAADVESDYTADHVAEAEAHSGPLSVIEALQEVSNVAMGQAGDLLARLLEVFVLLPIPKVNLLEVGELQMALQATEESDTISAVCQGFIGSGIAGEALLLFHDSSYSDMARLLRYEGELSDTAQMELLMDVASVLIGACTKGIADQLDIAFSQGHPVVLGQHVDISRLLEDNLWRWKRILSIEICYAIENHEINCDVLLLFTEDSLKVLKDKVAYLM